MDIPSLVEKTIGIYFLIIALSLIIRPDLWQKMINRITLDNGGQRTYFFFSLFLGIVVSLTHNIWDFTSAILVTVFGWALLIKSSIAFIYPEFFKKILPSGEKMGIFIRIWGVILVFLCIWILIPYYGPGVRFF
jgi:hypothetical protein